MNSENLSTPSPAKLVFIDTETTGLTRHWVEPEGRVIEFCALPVDVTFTSNQSNRLGYATPSTVRLDDQKVHFRLKISDEDMMTADLESLAVNGYHNDPRPFHGTTSTDLSTPGGKNTKDLWEKAANALHGRIVCSQNVMFDLQFVEKELRLYELNDMIRCWERKYIELWTLSALVGLTNIIPNDDSALTWRRNSIPSLEKAFNMFNRLEPGSMVAHTADGDVELGLKLFEHFLANTSTNNHQ